MPSELVIVLERQTDVFQNTSLIIPLNQGLTSQNTSGYFTAYCYQQSFKFVLIIKVLYLGILEYGRGTIVEFKVREIRSRVAKFGSKCYDVSRLLFAP